MKEIRKIFGSAVCGVTLTESETHETLENWSNLGYIEVDSALLYGFGSAEKFIGSLKLCQDHSKIHVSSKANPLRGFLAEDIVGQLNESLASLKRDYVEIYYLHYPDRETPIEETLKGVDQLYKEGKFKEFGLSNYSASEVDEIHRICKEEGYVLPTVYQGMYSAMTRDVEELFPTLRKLGIRFYAFSPLAHGLLSGKYHFSDSDEKQPRGTFFSDTKPLNTFTEMFRDMYWKNSFKAGIQEIEKVLATIYKGKVPLHNAALRWLLHHSKLADDDGIIIGCSRVEHLQSNVDALNGEPLHEDVVKVFENAWDTGKADCPKYYNAYKPLFERNSQKQ